jgi:hypothetical protein
MTSYYPMPETRTQEKIIQDKALLVAQKKLHSGEWTLQEAVPFLRFEYRRGFELQVSIESQLR